MSLNIQRKPCSKCQKSIGILTCDGCEQSFCAKHINEHRQDLSIEMDTVGQECDLLRHDLVRDENDLLPLIEQINHWEKESIEKIQEIARQTRIELEEYTTEKTNQINTILNKIIEDFQFSRQTGDYTEIDICLWTEQLNQLRKTLEKMPTVEINNETTISTIKLQKKIDLYFALQQTDETTLTTNDQLTKSPQEFFDEMITTDSALSTTHTNSSQRSTIVYISELYTTGIHEIHLRIEQKSNRYLFFGIINSLEQVTRIVFNSSSIYGWLAPDVRIIKSRKHLSAMSNRLFQAGDEIILTVNCMKHQILLEHPASDTIDRISIDSRICPFPWKVILVFFNQNDLARILY